MASDMTPEERQALLELWRDVPECRLTREGSHTHLVYDINHYARRFPDCQDNDPDWFWVDADWALIAPPTNTHKCCPHWERENVVAALARDAIMEWLHGHGPILSTKGSKGGSVAYRVSVNENESPSRGKVGSGFHPTRLLALISAARAVKGASDGE